jgi:hypothetical protein
MRVAKLKYAVLFSVLVTIVLVLIFIKLAFSLDGPPYRMILRPSDGQAIVRFMQRDRGLSTHEIYVDVAVERTWVVDLIGDDISIPGLSVDFYDNAPSPGCFRMQIGSTRLEIMETSDIVNGKRYGWRVNFADRH